MNAQTQAASAAIPSSPLEMPLQAGDIDLIGAVANSLRMAGLALHVEGAFLTHEVIQEGRGKSSDAQRFFLNRYWTQELSSLQNRTGISTADQRYCLVNKGDPRTWLKLFDEMILPTAMQHKLPALTQ